MFEAIFGMLSSRLDAEQSGGCYPASGVDLAIRS
jgi:hypothetical protein